MRSNRFEVKEPPGKGGFFTFTLFGSPQAGYWLRIATGNTLEKDLPDRVGVAARRGVAQWLIEKRAVRGIGK